MSNEDNLNNFAKKIANLTRTIDYTPILRNIRQIIDTSIQRNFQVGGRFGEGTLFGNPFGGGSKRWQVSAAARKRRGQTLRKTGQLAASIRVEVRQQDGKIVVVVGSNKNYAATMHYGRKRGEGGAYLPPRPYLVLQDEDIELIRTMLQRYISNLR